VHASNRPAAQPANRGSALLAVLWLSVALSAIAFSVAANVRSETERASTTADGVRAYYLAAGAIDRACLWIYWGMTSHYRNPDGSPRYYEPPMPRLEFPFPTGLATVEVIPEAGKLNVNTAKPEDLEHLLQTLGLDPDRSRAITAGIVQWRSQNGAAGVGAPDLSASLTPGSTFQAPHASLEELEEILLIPGMTPDIFYGRYDHEPSGRLIPRGGLRDCLTVWGASSKIDINTAAPALLESAGLTPDAVRVILSRRAVAPFKTMAEVAQVVPDAGVSARLGIGGNSIWTLRATARVRTANGRLSDLRRTVAAAVKFLDAAQFDPPYHILRWYDEAWSPGMPAL
jgi:general secretion pathway protein K